MKYLISTLLFAGFCLPAWAIDKAALDARIQKLTGKFEILQAKSDKRIPAQTLRKAQGIVLLDRTKAGFLFAYEGGGGLAMVKNPKTEQWSAPAFFKANEASLGFQIGGQQSFFVILLMNTNATHLLTEPSFNFGGEASGTAGNASGAAEGSFTPEEKLTLVYTDKDGLYGGVALKGGSISSDTDANIAYYGQFLTTKEILFGDKAQADEAAKQLVKAITDYYSK